MIPRIFPSRRWLRPWLTAWLVLLWVPAGFSQVSKYVTLLPEKATVADGGTVSFTVILQGHFNDKTFVCQVDFGDGSSEVWNRQSPINHTYHFRTKRPFMAVALVGTSPNGTFAERGRSAPVPITVHPPPPPQQEETKPAVQTKPTPAIRLSLRAVKNPAWVGEPVEFVVGVTYGGRIAGGAKVPEFDFTPGDGETVHITDTKFTYPYRRDGPFAPSIVVTGTDITASTRIVIRPRPQVSLSVPSTALKVNEDGQFEANVSPSTPGLGYVFHFDGDRTGVPSQNATIRHPFAAAGRHTAYVEVGPLVKGRPGISEVLNRSKDMDVQVGEPQQIQLFPAQFTAQEGETVWFTVSMSDGSDPGGFQFDPGEKWAGGGRIMRGPGFSYQYQRRGTYYPSVSIEGSTPASSIVTVSAKPIAGWIVAVASLVVLVAAGGIAKANHLFPFRPSVSFQAMPGKQTELRPGKTPPGIAIALCLKPNLAAARGQIRTLQPPLIKTRTKPHD